MWGCHADLKESATSVIAGSIRPDPCETNPECSLDNLETEEQDPSPFNLDEQKLFFIFRSYMEPATLVGPDDNELLYDRAIYFGPYLAEE